MKIAVVGAGISGLAASYILSKKYEVDLYESDSRLGGHAHTVEVIEGTNSVPMDSGFLVYNELTYPHLTAFFQHLGVETVASDMSLSIQAKKADIEWNGTDINRVFAQRKNLLRPQFYKMLLDVLRFAREADQSLLWSREKQATLGELLIEKKYSEYFKRNYIMPAAAAIWSTPSEKMLDFPAETFLQFFINHKLLQVNGRPIWRTVKNGSIQYVNKVAKELKSVYLNAKIQSIERKNTQVELLIDGQIRIYDKVVMATHPPQVLEMVKGLNDQEIEILSCFPYKGNKAYLHQQSGLMPKRKLAWASWNTMADDQSEVCLTYYLNRLQPLKTKNNYFVTLNPPEGSLNLNSIEREFFYEHPQFDKESIQAQKSLTQIQGVGGIYYAGAWTRYGFHEDGILSAVNVAKLMNIEIPWERLVQSEATPKKPARERLVP